jgi:hypothetical protein
VVLAAELILPTEQAAVASTAIVPFCLPVLLPLLGF